jgi:hypothetical protein
MTSVVVAYAMISLKLTLAATNHASRMTPQPVEVCDTSSCLGLHLREARRLTVHVLLKPPHLQQAVQRQYIVSKKTGLH